MSEEDKPVSGIEPSSSVYERLRDDIIAGRFRIDERLKIVPLARLYGVSTVPLREALQRLYGDGFVVISPNRGASVRRIDADLIRDISEFEELIEPYLVRQFVRLATAEDISELQAIQSRIEAVNFVDPVAHSELDTRFHMLMYDKHRNKRIVEAWKRNRQILAALARSMERSLSRRATVIREHRALIERIKAQDQDGAARIAAEHVAGAGTHWIEQMRKGTT